MPPVRLRLLAATLLAGALVASIATGGIPGLGSSAAAIAADSCAAVPADTSSSASPSASPGSLCVSVTGGESSVTAGDTTDWTVEIWSQGPVPSTVVALTVDQGAASFTGCPSGDGTAVCYTGNLGIGSAPTMYQMEAQVPTSSSGSVTLTATASAATTPAMSTNPSAAETITVTAPAPSANPTPASSATSGAASPSATPASSASSASTSPGSSSSSSSSSRSTTPARSSSSASPVGRSTGTSSTGLPVPPGLVSPPGLVPSLGPMPVDTNSPAPELLVPTGTIADMLPLIEPSPSSSPEFSPASAVQALPVNTNDAADPRSSTVGLSVGAAQDIGLIFLFIALLLAGTRIARRQPAAAAKANSAQPSPGSESSKVTRRHWHRPQFHLPRRKM